MRRSSSRPTRCSRGLLALALAAALWLSAAPARAETTAFTFFEGTQYPLTAFFLKGEVDGPTVMVQGGIQGDEPSGYVTAQVLTHARVLRGNLIVVPRANVPSINLHLRAVNVDMNRRFDQDYNRFYEDRLARVVRFLLSQCDALIHLHEGSGFYNPTYVDSLRNPQRYGQSIIVDALTYGDDIRLGDTVKRVLDELNPGIQPPNWRFNLFNTETFNSDSKHLEQRKSLTFYALSSLKIPALAVEVSKNITQLDWKVTRQLEATVVLLKQYGVEVAPPGLTAQELEDHLAQAGRVRINGRELPAGGVVDLMPGSPISVEPETRSDDPLGPTVAVFASDRPGVNLLTAPRMPLESFASLEVRSDGEPVRHATVHWTGEMPAPARGDGPVFVCWLNGAPAFVRAGDVLHTVAGDQLILEGVWGSHRDEVLNLKGYVAETGRNTGQDKGWEIILDPDNFLGRYERDNGRASVTRFEVMRETRGAPKAHFFVDIAPREVHALRLADAHGQSLVIPWSPQHDYALPAGHYTLLDAWSNGRADKVLTTVDNHPVKPGATLTVPDAGSTRVDLHMATTFAPLGSMTFRPSNLAQAGPALN